MFGIVLELQARGVLRGDDLARRFETSVRTIYRDVLALCEAGVPVVSLPGRGYTLPDDYFLPPLSLGLEEAVALALGATYVAQTLGPAYRTAASSAGEKIAATVPQRLRAPFDEARRSMRLVGRLSDVEAAHVDAVRDAIAERRVLEIYYRGRSSDDAPGRGESPRRVAPYGLAHVAGAWYLVGHSYEREALRRFRLSRVESLLATAERFEFPRDFSLERVEDDDSKRAWSTVRIAFDAGDLAFVRERLEGLGDVTIAPLGDGLGATFEAREPLALVSRVLSWGAAVGIIEPESLRDAVAAAARAILERHARN